jgi:small-conductance mechanosensitive channel
MNRTVQDLVRALSGLLIFIALVTAWWLDWRGFWHGVAAAAQVWWLWSIRPHGANSVNHMTSGNENNNEKGRGDGY